MRRVLEVTISQAGEPCLTGLFTFVVLDRHSAENLLGRPMPDAWLRLWR